MKYFLKIFPKKIDTIAIQTGVVKEDTIYADYFAKTCGFENKKELLKYTKAVFELADKEK